MASGIRSGLNWPQALVRSPDRWIGAVLAAIPLCFAIDRLCGPATQWLLAVVAWWALLGALRVRTVSDRARVLSLVALATCAEIVFSVVLGWYTYRLENVPPWIPPAHGIVFLTALLWSEAEFARRRELVISVLITVAATAYAVWGYLVNADAAGAIGVAVFLLWLWCTGPERARFYSMMWILVVYLEMLGVLLGAWQWAPEMPVLGLSQGNPPTGIVGVYGFFDLAAFGCAWLALEASPLRRCRPFGAEAAWGSEEPESTRLL